MAGGYPVHAGAYEERHVANGGAGSWRAHGRSGTLVRERAVMQLVDNCAPPYLTARFPNIFSMWDYVPHVSHLLQATWTQRKHRMQSDGGDRMDPSPHDH